MAEGRHGVVIPRSALLETGERALVFVEDSAGNLVPRSVTPGRASGREVEIMAGLTAGERVVASAAFLVDAESNLGALMGMEDGGGIDEMDHSGHEMGGEPEEEVNSSQMDHSGHQTGSTPAGGMDHSGHDTAGGDQESRDPAASDHTSHAMGGMAAADTTHPLL